MRLSIIGTGFVGLTSAVVYANKGHRVIAMDIDFEKVDALSKGKCHIHEEALPELLVSGIESRNLGFTTSIDLAVQSSDIVMVTVGTPPTRDGSADLSFLHQVVEDVVRVADHDIILVIKSTVPVGTNRRIMEMVSKCEYKITVVSNPEFLAEGTAVRDTLNMSRVVIGSDCDEAKKTMIELHQGMTTNFMLTDLESAELVKHASNAFLATKISFMNGIASLCEKYGGNVDEVARGMGFDDRIGNKFLNAGLGFGGSCFPKDVLSLRNLSEDVNNQLYTLLASVLNINSSAKFDIAFKLDELMNNRMAKRKVAVLGLSFKPNTNDVREAPSLVIINSLLGLGADVHVYDPAVTESEIKNALLTSGYRDNIKFSKSTADALTDAEGAVIVTEWKEFKELGEEKYIKLMKSPNVADGRGVLDVKRAKELGINLYSIGRN